MTNKKIIISLIIISMLLQGNFIASETSNIIIPKNTNINKNIALQSLFAEKDIPKQKEILQETLKKIDQFEDESSVFYRLSYLLKLNGVENWGELFKRFVRKVKEK